MGQPFSYRYATIAELREAYGAGRADPVAVIEEAMSLAEGVGRRYVATAAVPSSRARAEATRARSGLSWVQRRRLGGIPYGAKDVMAARGAPTSWGVTSMLNRFIDADAEVIHRLSTSGACLVAKLVTTSLAGGGGHVIAGASAHGQPQNAWARERFAGSSSSGSALAVALGIVPFALGTETGGSVIQPAAFAGVTGFRPTLGRVPRSGVMGLSARLDKVGVLAHTASDCAEVLSVIGGKHDADGYTLMTNLASTPRCVTGLRIGISPREVTTVDSPLRKALTEALGELGGLVQDVIDAEIAADVPYGSAIELLIRVDAATSLAQYIQAPDFEVADDYQRRRLLDASQVSAVDYSAAMDVMDEARRQFALIFSHVDLLVTASWPAQPQKRSEPRVARGSDSVSERLLAAANLAGVPGISLPGGLDEDGLPVGIHIIGPRGSDTLLLRLGAAFQHRTAYHRAHPPQ